jgi:adenylate kinase
MYHLEFDPPADGRCAKCGGELYQREDDREDTIRARLSVFGRETQPVLDYYRRLGKVEDVDGVGTPEDVMDRVVQRVAREK